MTGCDTAPASAGGPGRLVADLRARLVEACRGALGDARGAAVLGFPDHGNVGDSAIWLGQLAVLEELGLGRPRYASGRRTYDRRTLARRLRPGDVILLAGGGNLGDLWPEEQAFRERVLRDFPDRRVIQLPQSIHFRRTDALEAARAVFSSHPGFSLLVRDGRSLEIARERLGLDARLAPDMAFGLAPLDRPGQPAEASVLWLAREDREAREGSSGPDVTPTVPGARVVRRDWTADDAGWRVRLSRRLRGELVDRPRSLARLWRVAARADEAAARARLARGLCLLSSHRTVVTDRLHGHVLSMLLGIPHVLMDNSYGKLSAFHRTWTEGCPWAVRQDDAGEALRLAGALAAEGERPADGVPA